MKKVFFKVSLLLSFTLVLFIFSSQDASANGFNLELVSSSKVDFENLYIKKSDGSITAFDNIKDMQLHLNYINSNGYAPEFITLARLGHRLIGTQYKYRVFSGYSKFTPFWTKASLYTLTNNQSESFSSTTNTDWGSINFSFSKSYGVSTNIPADSTRYSRLAGYADLKIERYYVSLPNLHNGYYKTEVTVQNIYIDPIYQ